MAPLLALVSYLLGGIPFAYLLVRFVHGEDVRSRGSGNVGATNAARFFSRRWQLPAFLLLFALDACKGGFAVLMLPRWIEAGESAPALAGLFAVLGHTFCPYLRFRGGKGVATTLGVLAALELLATGAALLAFALVYALTRMVAAGSLALAVALPVAVILHGIAPPAVIALTLFLAALIIVRHRSNIAGMLRRHEA